MTVIQHPWQNGPTELISYALDHLHKTSDFDRRIAFLLLDVGVETLFKTFLTLPDEVTKAQGSYHERKEAAEGNFHELIRGVGKATGTRLSGFDLTHVQFYHELRNKLYHQGNGITIPTDKAQEYAQLAVDLLRVLLGIDLSGKLKEPEIKAQHSKEIEQLNRTIRCQEELVERAIEDVDLAIQLAIERVEPRLVLPSFSRQFEAVISNYKEVSYHDDGNEYMQITQSPNKRLEFARKMVEYLDAVIQNPNFKPLLFCKREYRFPFIGTEKLEPVAYYLLQDDYPDTMSIYFAILEILMPEVDDWKNQYELASMYPRYPEQPEQSLEDVLTGTEEHLERLQEMRGSIYKWATQS